MRRTLGVLIAGVALVVAAPVAGAADKSVKVGPNGKLGDDSHAVTLAVKVKCTNNATYKLQGKVKQGSVIGKGSGTVDCVKGKTVSATVKTTADGAFATGDADGCVAANKKGSNAKADPTCQGIKVIA